MYDEMPVQKVETPRHVQRYLAAVPRHRAPVFPDAPARDLLMNARTKAKSCKSCKRRPSHMLTRDIRVVGFDGHILADLSRPSRLHDRSGVVNCDLLPVPQQFTSGVLAQRRKEIAILHVLEDHQRLLIRLTGAQELRTHDT